MQSLYLLIPLSLCFLILAIVIYFWAVADGQFDDLDSAGERIVFDDQAIKERND